MSRMPCHAVLLCRLQKQVFELEDRFKKAMMSNAQLDNEKQKLR